MRERGKQRIRKLTSLFMPVAMLGSLLVGMAMPVAAEGTQQTTPSTAESYSVVDDLTLNAWQNTNGEDALNNTVNMGRVWTDKSVSAGDITLTNLDETATQTIGKGGSDFLIAYSALSSTAQISTQQAISDPLDIVLVLDGSSSLWNPPVGQDKLGPKLQAAANSFIDSVLKKSTASVQHRIAIVRFGGKLTEDEYKAFKESKIITDFTSDSDVLGDAVSQATQQESGVPTASHFGLQLAEDLFNGRTDHNREQIELGGAREGAKKVVVFFTDGVPTDPNENEDTFNPVIAAQAVNSAKNLKDMDATIYAVGVYNDEVANQIDNYMNAISSNYPNAIADDANNIILGDPSNQEGKYYTSTDNGDDLNDMFNDVLQDIITKPNSSPIVEQEGSDGSEIGHITFTDTLGDYMQVDDFKKIVFANTVFDYVTGPEEVENEPNTVKYTFHGDPVEANEFYPEGDVANIVIRVTKSTSLQQGDVVRVEIPISMIPLRKYTVNVTANEEATTEISNTYPIRLFYGVSVKSAVKSALADMSKADTYITSQDELTALKNYVADNNDGNGHVKFYSNKYVQGNETQVYSNFHPAKTNDFYYFQADTPLYRDATCQTPATGEVNENSTYYYKEIYYEEGVESAQTKVVTVSGATAVAAKEHIAKDGENLYIKAGTAKLTNLKDHAIDKLPLPSEGQEPEEDKYYNKTGTADYVTSPSWDTTNTEYVNVALGNNGVLFASYTPAPAVLDGDANLTVTKTLNGREWQQGDEFTFTLSTTNSDGVALPTNKTVTITEGTSDHKAAFGDVTFTKAGNYVLTIQEQKGALSNMTYDAAVKTIQVTVTDNQNGTLTATATGDVNPTFVNTYKEPVATQTPKPSATTTTTSQTPAATAKPTPAPTAAPTATPVATVIPQTGDASQPLVWVVLAAGALVLLAILWVVKRRSASK